MIRTARTRAMQRSLAWFLLTFSFIIHTACEQSDPAVAPAPPPSGLPPHLAAIELPPAPTLTPDQALAALRVAPGFRVEQVAAEPLVVDPVAIAWDEAGLLYVVEMRGYMPALDGSGEDEPVGRVVVLEDTDGDGAMDRSTPFMKGLVLPRALAPAAGGLLVGAPPDLWFCRDTDGDRRCDDRRRVGSYGEVESALGPEHIENGLRWGLDNGYYNAKSDRRMRFVDGTLHLEQTRFRGQWGIDQDDQGRLFYNTNSTVLFVDLFPSGYLGRHPATRKTATGLGVNLLPDLELAPIRVNLGVTGAGVEGALHLDGRLRRPTAASGLAVQRGGQFGSEFAGDVFVPEPAGNLVVQIRLRADVAQLEAEHVTYPDPDYGRREFLASTDERFRPVNAAVGPDGALYIVDMYRGVIQHAEFMGAELTEHIRKLGLDSPLGHGRIYRIVREDEGISREPVRLLDASDARLVAELSHANGWVRDTAQRLLVERRTKSIAALRKLESHSAIGRIHALWTLHGLGAIDGVTVGAALRDPDQDVRIHGLRVAEALIGTGEEADVLALAVRLGTETSAAVRLQAMFTLGEASARVQVRDEMLGLLEAHLDEPNLLAAAISGLAGWESEFAERAIGRPQWSEQTPGRAHALAALSHAAFVRLQAQAEDELASFLSWLEVLPVHTSWQREALLAGLGAAVEEPGFRPHELVERPGLFSAAALAQAETPLLGQARLAVTWPGDEARSGSQPLSEEEQARVARGAAVYAGTCAACHGAEGLGQAGLAPRLVDSAWALDSDAWLARIVRNGIAGPIEVAGETWSLDMPAIGAGLGDEELADLLSYLRRAWGHTGALVSPGTIARIRQETRERKTPWTVAELLALPAKRMDHRLDRYTGRYRLGLMPISLSVRRESTDLFLSAPTQGDDLISLRPDGRWVPSQRENVSFEFEENRHGEVAALLVHIGGTSEPPRFKKVE